jgi:hypothetical protein
VVRLRAERDYSERPPQADRLVEQWRSTQRYQARIDYEERRIRRRLHELARKHPGSGYRRMTRLLRREGLRPRAFAMQASASGRAARQAVERSPRMGRREESPT